MRKSEETSFKLFSHYNVFNDCEKLHPGFRINRLLLVLTRTKPHHKRYIKLSGNEIDSPHLDKTPCYLTTADNQQAKRFNNLSSGKLLLPKENLSPLIPTTNSLNGQSPINPLFNMSDQTTAPVATNPAAGQAAKILLILTAAGTSRALLLNPTIDGFPLVDGKELTQWLAEVNAKLPATAAQEATAMFAHYEGFVRNGVPAENEPYWNVIQEPCTVVHISGVAKILVEELKKSTTVNFDQEAFNAWMGKQEEQTLALGIAYQAVFSTGIDQEVAVMEIGSSLHVPADPAAAVEALQNAVENALPTAATTEGVVDAESIVTEATAPDAAAIETPTTPVAEVTVEDVETTDGGTAIQALSGQNNFLIAAAKSASAAAGQFKAIEEASNAIGKMAAAAAEMQEATAEVLLAAGAQAPQTVQLTANAETAAE